MKTIPYTEGEMSSAITYLYNSQKLYFSSDFYSYLANKERERKCVCV